MKGSRRDLRAMAEQLPASETVFGMPVDREWREVYRYPPTNEDGHEAAVHVARYPAEFWRVTCPDLGIDLSTGSGMPELADSMAQAIAEGMLGVTKEAER